MEYFILFLAVLCIAGQSNINKVYQKKFAHELKDMLFFPFVCGIASVIFFILLGFILYGGLPEFSMFSLSMSLILAFVGTAIIIVGIIIMKYGKMSVYSVFMMLGGMLLPYLYGILFLGETVSPARIAGLIVLICAPPCSVINARPAKEKTKTSVKFYYFLCALIFCLNGTLSIISKMHSVNGSAVPAVNFIVYINLWQIVITGIAYFIVLPRLEKSKKYNNTPAANQTGFYALVTVTVYAAVSGVGYLFQLIAAQTVPAVALYPFITGGSIVFTTVGARIFFKEKLSLFAVAGIIMSVIGALLFLIDR